MLAHSRNAVAETLIVIRPGSATPGDHGRQGGPKVSFFWSLSDARMPANRVKAKFEPQAEKCVSVWARAVPQSAFPLRDVIKSGG